MVFIHWISYDDARHILFTLSTFFTELVVVGCRWPIVSTFIGCECVFAADLFEFGPCLIYSCIRLYSRLTVFLYSFFLFVKENYFSPAIKFCFSREANGWSVFWLDRTLVAIKQIEMGFSKLKIRGSFNPVLLPGSNSMNIGSKARTKRIKYIQTKISRIQLPKSILLGRIMHILRSTKGNLYTPTAFRMVESSFACYQ